MQMHLPALILLIAALIIPDAWISYRLCHRKRHWAFHLFYWLPTVLFLICFILLRTNGEDIHSPQFSYKVIWVFGAFAIIYVPKLLFTLFNQLDFLLNRFLSKPSRVLTIIGQALASIVFIGLFWGMIYTRKHIVIKEVTIEHAHLPEEFDGWRIVHFSDAHLGNWGRDTHTVAQAVDKINALQPDIICFTGDMVNNFGSELDNFIPIFKQLHAPDGIFAILGNHDYGDYTKWESPTERNANLEATKQGLRDSGFQLLLNENKAIVHQEDTIYIAGVENWGKPPFPQYGNLQQAIASIPPNKFTLLLSHDVSHWQAEVVGHTDIALTLSGHTHAAQIGLVTQHFQISPSAWIYKEWDGLYEQNAQYLYVNRGLGYIGMPIRLGVPPEITVITLRKKR